MKEKLTCSKCSKTWMRKKVRGRKPLFCSDCSKPLEAISQPSSNPKQKRMIRVATSKESSKNSSKEKETILNSSKWQCPSCLVSIGVEVKISQPPTHRCQKRGNRSYPLEQVTKIIKTKTS